MTDISSNAVVWDVEINSNVAFCDFSLSPGKNSAFLGDLADYVALLCFDDAENLSHDGRHTAVTRMLQAGIDLTIGSIAGHKDRTMLLRYGHATSQSRDEAVAALENFGGERLGLGLDTTDEDMHPQVFISVWCRRSA